MAGSVGNRIFNGVAAVVVVVLTICVVRFNVPQFRDYRSCIERRDSLQERNAASNAELSELASRQERFRTDPDFIIHMAHANRKVFADEVVFSFPGPDIE